MNDKQALMERMAKLFAEKSEKEKAFILGYMAATAQSKPVEQTS